MLVKKEICINQKTFKINGIFIYKYFIYIYVYACLFLTKFTAHWGRGSILRFYFIYIAYLLY